MGLALRPRGGGGRLAGLGMLAHSGLRQLRRENKPQEVAAAAGGAAAIPDAAVPDDDFPELTEEDLAEDPEIAELLGDNP